MKHFSPWQFTLFRIVFGLYLSVHFFMLLPYAGELFGREGLIGNAALNPCAGLFPNPLALDLPGWFSFAFVASLCLCALVFTVGWMRPVAAGLLWFGWTALFHRNNLIGNPSIPYIGLLLILCVIIPGGEPLRIGKKTMKKWEMPVWVFRTAWILLAVGYSFSGLTKCLSPSWVDGSAMKYLLANPLARPGLVLELMSLFPDSILRVLTWGTVLLEVLFVPLAIFKKTRPWVWFLMVLMHLGILSVIDFADLSFGMLMIHAFTFDSRWVMPIAPKTGKLTVAFDGECLMCSRFIRFIAAEDYHDSIRLTTLQGRIGERMRRLRGDVSIQSLLVEFDGAIENKSAAVLRVFSALGGHWTLLARLGRCFPLVFRDGIYDWVAGRRHQWFRNDAVCELPSPELSVRLLMDD